MFVKNVKSAEDPTQGMLATGFLFLGKGQVNDAAGEFRSVLKQNPKSPFAHLGMAGCYFHDGKFPKVAEECEAALSTNPSLVEALTIQADLAIQEEDYPEAIELLRRALGVNPNHLTARTRLATVHYLKKDLESYEKERQAIFSVHPTYAEFCLAIGGAAERLSRPQIAQQFYEKAHEMSADSWRALESLGFFYCRAGREKEAYHLLERSFERNRFNRRVFNLLQTLDYMKDFVSSETDGFTIRVHRKKDSCLTGYASRYLEEARRKLEEQYSVKLPHKVLVELFPRHDFFAARVHGLPGIGLNGVCFGKVVAMDSPRVSPGRFNWKNVLVHEFSHAVTLHLSDHRVPRWLTEGLAVHDERDHRNDHQDQMLVTAWKKGELIPLDRLNRSFTRPKSRFQVLLAYVQAELAVDYLVKTGGFDKILKMLEGFRKGDDLEKVVKDLFGQSLDELSEAILAHTSSVASSLPVLPRYGPQDLPALKKATEDEPKEAGALAQYALGLLMTGQIPQAEQTAKQALELDPQSPLATRILGEAEFAQKYYEEALDYFEKAAELDPKPMGVYLRLAQTAKELRKPTDALDYLRKAAERYDRCPPVYSLMEKIADETKNTQARLDALEGMLKCDRLVALAGPKLLKAYSAVASNANVVRVANRLFELDPYQVEAHGLLAQTYEANGKLDAAASEYLVCIQLEPRKIAHHLKLANVLRRNNQKDEARRVLQQARKTDRNNPKVKRMLEEMGP